MKVVEVKTVRFANLVQNFGHPHIKTLWSDPRSDRDLQKAVQENRVLTVAQNNTGTRKEYGVIGFFPEQRGAFLIFPQPISYAAGVKVIGLKWDLVVENKPRDPVDWEVWRKEHPRKKPVKTRPVMPAWIAHEEENELAKKDSPEPLPLSPRKAAGPKPPRSKLFDIQIELAATSLVEIQIEARSPKEARKKALAAAPEVDWSRAEVKRRIKKLRLAERN